MILSLFYVVSPLINELLNKQSLRLEELSVEHSLGMQAAVTFDEGCRKERG